MKLLHISDLHVGKRLGEISLLEDQRFILSQILGIAADEKPDAVVVAGDVYDKPMPGTDAVTLFDEFLTRLASQGAPVFIIGGNHDSQERLAFGSNLFESSSIYISKPHEGSKEPVVLQDEYGPVNIYLLPFVKPVHVRRLYEDESIDSYDGAVSCAVEHMNVDGAQRNVLVAHQFVTGAERSDSEELAIGGLDNIGTAAFSDFDYVALGHIHRPQSVGGASNVRYSGSPLKYSLSEAAYNKSVVVVTLKEKRDVSVELIPLTPLRDMRELRGTYDELMAKSFYDGLPSLDDYFGITLTDEADVPEALGKLRVVYQNIVSLRYDNKRTRENKDIGSPEDVKGKSPMELFSEFYELQNNLAMSREQQEVAMGMIEHIWEGDEK